MARGPKVKSNRSILRCLGLGIAGLSPLSAGVCGSKETPVEPCAIPAPGAELVVDTNREAWSAWERSYRLEVVNRSKRAWYLVPFHSNGPMRGCSMGMSGPTGTPTSWNWTSRLARS